MFITFFSRIDFIIIASTSSIIKVNILSIKKISILKKLLNNAKSFQFKERIQKNSSILLNVL
jgi:hypothetical protein